MGDRNVVELRIDVLSHDRTLLQKTAQSANAVLDALKIGAPQVCRTGQMPDGIDCRD